MKPRSSIRSIRPVAFENETFRTSASWLIVISPARWSVYMMWSWAMLTAETQQLLARCAFQLAHRRPEIGDDVAGRVWLLDRRDRCRGLFDSLCHANYLIRPNYSVNIND